MCKHIIKLSWPVIELEQSQQKGFAKLKKCIHKKMYSNKTCVVLPPKHHFQYCIDTVTPKIKNRSQFTQNVS